MKGRVSSLKILLQLQEKIPSRAEVMGIKDWVEILLGGIKFIAGPGLGESKSESLFVTQ